MTETQGDINKLQDEAILKMRGLSAQQLQEILSSFQHTELVEAHPDIYIAHGSSVHNPSHGGGVVVWSYYSREGRYMISDPETFSKYIHVVPLTPRRQLCFSDKNADVLEDTKVVSSLSLPFDLGGARLLSIVHIPSKRKVVICQRGVTHSISLSVFTEDGKLLSEVGVNYMSRAFKEFRGNLGVSYSSGGLGKDFNVFSLDEQGKLELSKHFPNTVTLLDMKTKYIAVTKTTLDIYNLADEKVNSVRFVTRSPGIEINENTFALVNNRSEIEVLSLVGDAIVPIQRLPFAMYRPGGLRELDRIDDEMFIASSNLWKLILGTGQEKKTSLSGKTKKGEKELPAKEIRKRQVLRERSEAKEKAALVKANKELMRQRREVKEGKSGQYRNIQAPFATEAESVTAGFIPLPAKERIRGLLDVMTVPKVLADIVFDFIIKKGT